MPSGMMDSPARTETLPASASAASTSTSCASGYRLRIDERARRRQLHQVVNRAARAPDATSSIWVRPELYQCGCFAQSPNRHAPIMAVVISTFIDAALCQRRKPWHRASMASHKRNCRRTADEQHCRHCQQRATSPPKGDTAWMRATSACR